MWPTPKYGFILLPFMAISGFSQKTNSYNTIRTYSNSTSRSTTCTSSEYVGQTQLQWIVTATSTRTFYNLTVIPQVTRYPNNASVTKYITVTPTEKPPSLTVAISFGGSKCVYPTWCIEAPRSSVSCAITGSIVTVAPISALTLLQTPWTEPAQVVLVSEDTTTSKSSNSQPVSSQPAPRPSDDPSSNTQPESRQPVALRPSESSPSDTQPQPSQPVPRPPGGPLLPSPGNPLTSPASDATSSPQPQPQPSLEPQTSLLDPDVVSPKTLPNNPSIPPILDSTLAVPVPSDAVPSSLSSPPVPATTPFISVLLPSTTLLLQPGQATTINNAPVSFVAGGSAIVIGTQAIPISLGTAASTFALSGIELASISGVVTSGGSGVTIVVGPSTGPGTTTGAGRKNSPSGAVRVLLPSKTLLLEPGQATAIGNTPVSFVAGGSAIVIGTQTIPISVGTAATTFALSGIEPASGSGAVTAGSGVTVVFVPPATVGVNGKSRSEDPSSTTSPLTDTSLLGSGTETGVQSRTSGPVMFTGAAARKALGRHEWVWGIFGVVFI